MTHLLAPVMGLFTAGGGAAASAALGPGMWGASLATAVPLAGAFPAAPVAAAAGAAAGGGMLSSILQGTASVLGVVSSIAAGNRDAEQAELAALDAEREQPIENLQSTERRRTLRAAAAEALGELDVAYASSGADLSFGTAAEARNAAHRELDLGLTSEAGTTMTRLARLRERSVNYRTSAKRLRRAGVVNGLIGGLQAGASLAQRY
jgi:hypothetical protein